MTALLILVSVVSSGISATPSLLTTSASGAFSFNLSAQVNKFAKQLRQASGKQDSLFGGFSLILIGDFAQLPPVADRPLYAVDKPDAHGHILYRQFDTVVILDEMVRQSGASQEQVLFRDLLRLRNGESTEEDWQLLLSRSPSAITNLTEFNDAVHLFYNKDKVAQFNAQKLNSLGTPIARINNKRNLN